jgi:uncharacterized repeat protein (TIGR01451 family)
VTDPVGGNNSATDHDTLTPKADLAVTGNTAAPATIYANGTDAQNTIVFTLTAKNNGPSDAQNAVLKDDLPGLIASGAQFCPATSGGVCTGAYVAYPGSGIPIGTMLAGASATFNIKAHADSALRNGPLAKTDTATVSSDTLDPGPTVNTRTSNYTIDTVPSPPQHVTAQAGNASAPPAAILSWDPPANNGGVALNSSIPYQITISGGPGAGTYDVNPTSGASCSGGSSLCVSIPVPGAPALANGTTYTFSVKARNAVGLSDQSGTATAKPSIDNQASIVAPQATKNLTTCAHATAADPVCVQYLVPSGAGGVFSLFDAFTLPANFCGGTACAGNVGPSDLAPPSGYGDPKHPIIEIVTWDRTISPNGPHTKVYFQSPKVNGGASFQLPSCAKAKTPTASPDPCLNSLKELDGPSIDDDDVRAVILLTSNSDGFVGHK